MTLGVLLKGKKAGAAAYSTAPEFFSLAFRFRLTIDRLFDRRLAIADGLLDQGSAFCADNTAGQNHTQNG